MNMKIRVMNLTYILQCYMYTWVHARIKQTSWGPEDDFVCEGGVPRLESFFSVTT